MKKAMIAWPPAFVIKTSHSEHQLLGLSDGKLCVFSFFLSLRIRLFSLYSPFFTRQHLEFPLGTTSTPHSITVVG